MLGGRERISPSIRSDSSNCPECLRARLEERRAVATYYRKAAHSLMAELRMATMDRLKASASQQALVAGPGDIQLVG